VYADQGGVSVTKAQRELEDKLVEIESRNPERYSRWGPKDEQYLRSLALFFESEMSDLEAKIEAKRVELAELSRRTPLTTGGEVVKQQRRRSRLWSDITRLYKLWYVDAFLMVYVAHVYRSSSCARSGCLYVRVRMREVCVGVFVNVRTCAFEGSTRGQAPVCVYDCICALVCIYVRAQRVV
jgi:hypothetical protein